MTSNASDLDAGATIDQYCKTMPVIADGAITKGDLCYISGWGGSGNLVPKVKKIGASGEQDAFCGAMYDAKDEETTQVIYEGIFKPRNAFGGTIATGNKQTRVPLSMLNGKIVVSGTTGGSGASFAINWGPNRANNDTGTIWLHGASIGRPAA